MIQGHGGNKQRLADHLGCPVDEIIDMSSNLNPLGPPDYIHELIQDKVSAIHALPEPDAAAMTAGFARFHHIERDEVLAGNGTTFFIYTIPIALNAQRVLILGPTYSDYQDACAMFNIPCTHYISEPKTGFAPEMSRVGQMAEEADLVFICNPNNPTGALIEKREMEALISSHPNTCFVVDESYLPFVDYAHDYSFVTDTQYPNLLVLSSMSKIFRIPGLRTGFVSGARPLIQKVMAHYQPWSVNSLAQEVIRDIFTHPNRIQPFYEKTRAYIKKEKALFLKELKDVEGIQLFEAPTYFVLASLTAMKAEDFCAGIGRDKLLIRDCSNFKGLSNQFVRFSLKGREVNLALSKSIKRVLANG